MNIDYVNPKVGAHRLSDAQLVNQHELMLGWLCETAEDVAQSKFSLEGAWFREVNWELQRRNLLVVH